MIEKRSIEEILKSIFLLVNEAKSKNKQIESSFKTEDSLNKTLVFNNLDKSILEEKKIWILILCWYQSTTKSRVT